MTQLISVKARTRWRIWNIFVTFFVEDRSINVSNDFTVNILKAGLGSCILIVIIHN